MSDQWKLHRVSAKVRPLPWHPKYYDWQFGFISIWLFANSIDDSSDRALRILDLLPYERVGDDLGVETGFPQTEESRAMQDRAQEKAEQIGFAIRLIAVETGADEIAFEKSPL